VLELKLLFMVIISTGTWWSLLLYLTILFDLSCNCLPFSFREFYRLWHGVFCPIKLFLKTISIRQPLFIRNCLVSEKITPLFSTLVGLYSLHGDVNVLIFGNTPFFFLQNWLQNFMYFRHPLNSLRDHGCPRNRLGNFSWRSCSSVCLRLENWPRCKPL
jgi:hypothetical protein